MGRKRLLQAVLQVLRDIETELGGGVDGFFRDENLEAAHRFLVVEAIPAVELLQRNDVDLLIHRLPQAIIERLRCLEEGGDAEADRR